MKENIHPPMHAAEHLLNRTMVNMFGCERCFSAHIEKKKSKCDYHFTRPLTEEQVKTIEDKVNEIISQDLPVREAFMPINEVREQLSYSKPLDGDDIRLIRIGDYDIIPCYGPHVASTKEVGVFKIISSDFNNRVLRIRYKLN